MPRKRNDWMISRERMTCLFSSSRPRETAAQRFNDPGQSFSRLGDFVKPLQAGHFRVQTGDDMCGDHFVL